MTIIYVDVILQEETITTLKEQLDSFGQPLFLNMAKIRLSALEDGYDIDGTLALIAGPPLRTFEDLYGYNDCEIIERLEVIARVSPHLTDLILDLLAVSFSETPDYTSFPELRQVKLTGVVWKKGWEALSDCPSLETLAIGEDRSKAATDMVGEQEAGRVGFTFPKLRHLSIDSRSRVEPSAADLLSLSTMPGLRSLAVLLYAQDAYTQLLTHLRKTSPHLEDLDVTTFKFMLVLDTRGYTGDDFRLGKLRRLVLASPAHGVGVEDAALEQIGSRLPELRELRVDNVSVKRPTDFCDCYHATELTPQSLSCLGKACRNLEEFTISVTDPVDLDGRITPDPENRLQNLKRLKFHHLGVGEADYEGLAEWLAILCPKVYHLDVECLTMAGSPDAARGEINGFVKSFFAAQKRQSSGSL